MRTALIATALLFTACPAQEKRPIRVAAASDLTAAFGAMKAAFEAEAGEPVDLVFGSSGQLAKQIVEGAPFDVFAAANVAFTDETIKEGRCDGRSRAVYAHGQLVLVGAPSLEALKDAKVVKIAIAHPELAPYGRAAKDALTAAGVWAAVEPKLVYGQNVQQTLQLQRSGNAEAALVSKTQAPDGVAVGLQPLQQAIVSCGKDPRGARFHAFVLGAQGRKILADAGFGLP